MKILFYLGHPAHFHLFKNVILELKNKNHEVTILIKKKDVLENLLIENNIEYTNILPEGRKDTKLGIAIGLIKRDMKLFSHCFKNKPDMMLGTSSEISHVGKLFNIPSVCVNEDDATTVPVFAKLSYPLATEIVTPSSCFNGKWESKSIKYNSYHELAYLHPNNFKADKSYLQKYGLKEPYSIIRFSKLNAHHDFGIKGINDDLAQTLINKLLKYGNVYITSEKELKDNFQNYGLSISSMDMHHILAFAQMFIGDSQTMTAEAAVLGIPALRFNDFVGRLGYLEELENKYELTFGFKTESA